jgi:hypothetical protein
MLTDSWHIPEVILPIFTESRASKRLAAIVTCKYLQKAALNLRALANFVLLEFLHEQV